MTSSQNIASLDDSLKTIRSASTTEQAKKQASQLIDYWVNRWLKDNEFPSQAQTIGAPGRAIDTLSFVQVVKINHVLASAPGRCIAARRKLLHAAAAQQGWPDRLTDSQQAKALAMLSALGSTKQAASLRAASTGGADNAKVTAHLRQAIFQKLILTDLPTSTASLQYTATIASQISRHLSDKQKQAGLKALKDSVFPSGKVSPNLPAAALRHALLAADYLVVPEKHLKYDVYQLK